MNFNTNQTRQLYVAGAINANVAKDKNSAGNAAAANLDINVSATATGEMAFYYKNADGIITRSDTFDPKKITSLKKTLGSDLAIKLMAHTITIKTANYANAAALAGKTVKLVVTFHQVYDYDDSNTRTFAVYHKVPTSETNENFYLALKTEIDKAIPASLVSAASSSGGLVLTEVAQKYVRGKLTVDPVPFTVAFGIESNDEPEWGSDAVAASGSTISGNYALADLEYFALGERGDVYRGGMWPNNYEPTYAFSKSIIEGATAYDVLTIEYYWAGSAENVQKSPRMIQVAAPHNASAASDICTILYDTIDAARNGVASS